MQCTEEIFDLKTQPSLKERNFPNASKMMRVVSFHLKDMDVLVEINRQILSISCVSGSFFSSWNLNGI